MADPIDVAMAFVGRINTGDADSIAPKMTAGHRFVGSGGDVHTGRETMREGWKACSRVYADSEPVRLWEGAGPEGSV